MESILIHNDVKETAFISTYGEKISELESIIENISDGMILMDKYNNVKLLNNGARDLFYIPDRVKKGGDTFWYTEYYDEQDTRISVDNIPGLRVLKGEKIQNERIKIVRPDKTIYIDLNGSPIFDDEGNISMALLCVRDITQRMQYEIMLKKQRSNMYNIINTLDSPIARLSYPDLDIIELNKKAREYLHNLKVCAHMDIESIRGRNIFGLFPDLECSNLGKLILRIAETKDTVSLNNSILKMQDAIIYANIVFQPLIDSSGQIIEILIVLMDVTKDTEKSKSLEKLLKTQEEFFSFIAHEFKTPITVTSTAVQAMKLLCGDELSVTAKGFIEQINKSILQQLRLVNNLLDITKADAGYLSINKRNLDIVYITKNILDSITLYAKQTGINIKFCTSVPKKIMAMDDEKYERILLNLLSNAIKFTPEGNSIYVNISMVKNNISIEVKDEGIGIPKNMQSIIFERFKQSENGLTRNSQGTGIGLCLVKILVKSLGGKITIESEEGKGSTFTVVFPCLTVDSTDDRQLQASLYDRLGQTVKIELSNI